MVSRDLPTQQSPSHVFINFLPTTQQNHPLCWVSLHSALLMGSPFPAICWGTRRAIQRQISILSYKTSSSVAEGRTRRRVSGLAPQAKSIWLSSVSAAATGGISKNSVTLSIYTCQGFGLFPQAWQGPRLRGPSVAPGSREIGVTLPTLQKRNLGAVDLRAHS